MVESALPIEASVMATSGAAIIRYSTEAKRLTAPAAMIASGSFLLYNAMIAITIINSDNRSEAIIINSIFSVLIVCDMFFLWKIFCQLVYYGAFGYLKPRVVSSTCQHMRRDRVGDDNKDDQHHQFPYPTG